MYKYRLPPRIELPKKLPIEHPKTMLELKQMAEQDKIAIYHHNFLKYCHDELVSHWMNPWKLIYAVGPFLHCRGKRKVIPMIVFANYRRIYRHIYAFSSVLVEPYLEFRIIPDVYVFPIKALSFFEETENKRWMKLKDVSICISNGE